MEAQYKFPNKKGQDERVSPKVDFSYTQGQEMKKASGRLDPGAPVHI